MIRAAQLVTLGWDHDGNPSKIVDDENMKWRPPTCWAALPTSRKEVILPTPALIGNPTAHQGHRTLGRLGDRSHSALASEVLGRTVTGLAALAAEDAATVRSYAFGQLGLETEVAV
ncbi:hypothetical protein [Deinococcus hopiensis]|uniref:Uncharacterized protein n=1 Tax=Deinococcus hopiensis KR-140 TaxID=695939 RepID=A0A1W1VCS9_9DEIO|nr:hypothetical protein [Deinococcus hopiensis]SMB91178.1 hypothetical protein SAMN00790413_01024 [Deinococcus hopiensis KR-140]